ncbi:WhiB family transcriptional regulator [Streptomyces sp. BH055]|uniref:WhiB family transcriptional regulator n=1 Tax=Streptomyces sp. BH055 TaxID=3401173 RepID=UPI003BB7D20B
MTIPQDWRGDAACARDGVDPDLMFPDSDRHNIAAARSVCAPCPVRTACLASAMAEERDWTKDRRHGVRGGLTGTQRAYRYRQLQLGALLSPEPPSATSALRPHAERTPQNALADHTTYTADGHLVWTGPPTIWVFGRSCAPKRLAFLVSHNRDPVGRVLGTCDYPDCVLPTHVADDIERMRCGTPAGYRLHQQQSTKACDACRQANTDADSRLRRTGTTKALA